MRRLWHRHFARVLAAVAVALTTAGIYWGKSEQYIDSERCYQITFEIEV